MRAFQRTIIALFALTLLAFLAVNLYTRFSLDRTPPVIHCDSDYLDVSINVTEEELLRGVTAMDNKDGDISSKVEINNISQLISSDTAKVYYIVFDSSNNLATASRTIHYTDYEKPMFSLQEPLIYSSDEVVSLMDRLTARDVLDGDISDRIRVTMKWSTTQYEGTYSITVQVTNSLGDSSVLPLKVIISNQGAAGQLIKLKEYITYLEQGEEFDPESFITEVRSSKGEKLPISSVNIASNVDTGVSGNYMVTYNVETAGQAYTAYLAVVVK